ncbi:hypothetical protein, partial [Streptococcus uberis]|uniref:hypothetical protein n=1 Tax=Streptococcus uberis TaxID=1349 RepID=UPI00379846AA
SLFGDLLKPLTNFVNEVLSTSFTPCRNGVFEILSLMQLLLIRLALFCDLLIPITDLEERCGNTFYFFRSFLL